ncbi:MAG: YfiT family bacillithiol transferase [Bacteroidota bacterium]
MEASQLEALKYPIGKYQVPETISPAHIQQWIQEIEILPGLLIDAVSTLSDLQLNMPYRPGGWTLRQVVHHVVDSHMNSYIRFKWTLTEDQPTIKAYYEDRWAELPEAKTAPVQVSLGLLASLHARWVMMLRNMTTEDWQRAYYHPEQERLIRLDENLGLYAWHGKHHLGHINSLKHGMGW